MSIVSRWLAPLILAAGFGVIALAPAPAQAQSSNDLIRVLVDVADVIYHSGQPYYRNGNYGYNDRLIVVRDPRGQPRYYRNVPRGHYVNVYRPAPPIYRGNGYRHGHDVKCDKHGKCQSKVSYYDPRHDRDRNHWRDRDHRHGGRR
jgi:hypothetical protein